MVLLDILISTFTKFSMLLLGLSLFRIPLKSKWPFLLLAIFGLSCLSPLFTVLHAEAFNPFVFILLQAVIVHVMFRVRKLHSLMVAFLGALGYTIYLAIALFMAIRLTPVPLHDYFYGVNLLSHLLLKLIAGTLACLTSYLLVKKRLGFTVRMEPFHSSRSLRTNALMIVFFISFVLFSFTYYAVTLHMAALFYFAGCFCMLLIGLIYLLYKKEMEER
ncbi:hypothetical protein [Paenibacillus sp. SI8]|uniref:hypothetical protein n=1 Tax=unclassified Paenibacillus TaxID=185978 RepID=UPI003466D806